MATDSIQNQEPPSSIKSKFEEVERSGSINIKKKDGTVKLKCSKQWRIFSKGHCMDLARWPAVATITDTASVIIPEIH